MSFADGRWVGRSLPPALEKAAIYTRYRDRCLSHNTHTYVINLAILPCPLT